MKNLLLAILILGSSALYGQQKVNYEAGQLIVQFNPAKNIASFARQLEERYGIAVGQIEELSDIASIYLLKFDDAAANLDQIEGVLRTYDEIWEVQKNHFVTIRETIPNDTDWDQLWHLKNDGSTGGTVDADIDATDAWDITTGGATTHADEIVVCVVEGGGVDTGHVDIKGNIWLNTVEIDDGLDNDGNGYIDDYAGWNVVDLNDDVGFGSHGTRVAGMIGAKGNNGIGVTGVNWDVKMMIVKGQTASNESSVLAAYNYPLKMRRMYNESFGAEGAFVVATNSSWGIDNGDPEDSPLWCAMYDTLGAAGILSVCATTNNNLNVDDVGDMPTTCTSEFIIATTMTNSDDVRASAGYGLTHVDLGAPGSNVRLPVPGNIYTNTSGTSFSTPCVTGAVALAYSTPCADFINFVKYNPKLAALAMKDYILENVDPIAALSSEVASGGRLNVNNTINAILADCDPGSCIAPYNLRLDNLTDAVAEISWDGFTSDFVFYIQEGTGPLVEIASPGSMTLTIDTLKPCTNYTVKIKALCPVSDTSIYSYPLTFKTDGCCNNPNVNLETKTEDLLQVKWNDVLYATQYDLRYREEGTASWTELSDVSSPYTASGLEACTNYEFQIYTLCTDSTHGFSESFVYRTLGCGACVEADYCEISGANDNQEWIDSIAINGFENGTGANGGWFVSEEIITALTPGETYTMKIAPGYSGFNFTETITVWIDYDHSGTFEAAEKVVNEITTNTTTYQMFSISMGATLGVTKMRIGMSALSAPQPCQSTNFWGEYEDYCVYIGPQTGIGEETNGIRIYPNPVSDRLFVQSEEQISSYLLYCQDGQLIRTDQLIGGSISTAHLAPGVYHLQLNTESGQTQHKFIKL